MRRRNEKGIFVKTHGESNTPFYYCWRDMKQKCSNPNSSLYYLYGEKGIKVCSRWNKYKNFRDDMRLSYLIAAYMFGAKNISLNMVDKNKGFSPDNCEWVLSARRPYREINPDKLVLKHRQSSSLEEKIKWSKDRIRDWYEIWGGGVSVSFSGGKDSTALLHLVRSIYPDVPAAFIDSGLEYPEIRAFVKTIDNVTWLKPKKPFIRVIKEYGYPVVSKKVARQIARLRMRNEKNKASCNLYLEGITKKGYYAPRWKLPKRWHSLIDAPFNTSAKCCYFIKQQPLRKYAYETGRKAMVAVKAEDSMARTNLFLSIKCSNNFSGIEPTSYPLSYWTNKDIWRYLRDYSVPYCKIYDEGIETTGCMFCCFGIHLEKEPNRFQSMRHTHPKIYDYCIHSLGIGDILDYIGVPYE